MHLGLKVSQLYYVCSINEENNWRKQKESRRWGNMHFKMETVEWRCNVVNTEQTESINSAVVIKCVNERGQTETGGQWIFFHFNANICLCFESALMLKCIHCWNATPVIYHSQSCTSNHLSCPHKYKNICLCVIRTILEVRKNTKDTMTQKRQETPWLSSRWMTHAEHS